MRFILSQIRLFLLLIVLGTTSLLAQEENGEVAPPVETAPENNTPTTPSSCEKKPEASTPAMPSATTSQDNDKVPNVTQDPNKPPASNANIAQDQYSIIESKYIDMWDSPIAPTWDTTSYRYQEWAQIRELIREHQILDPFNTDPFDPRSISFEINSEMKCQELPIFEKLGIPIAAFNANPLFPDCVERKLTEDEFVSFSNLKTYLAACSSDSVLSQAALFVEIEYIILLLEKRESHLDLYQQVSLNLFEESFLEPLQVDTSYFSLMSLQGKMISWENICRKSKCEKNEDNDSKHKDAKREDGSSQKSRDKIDKKPVPVSKKRK